MAFGSGLHGWGFNLDQFAGMYAERFKVKKERMVRKLWGSNFYSASQKKWIKVPEKGAERGFNKFVLEPVIMVNSFNQLSVHAVNAYFDLLAIKIY